MSEAKFSELLSKTIVSTDGVWLGSDSVKLQTMDGFEYELYHDDDCCEWVEVVDVCGDEEDLLNSEILLAEEVSSDVAPLGVKALHPNDSETWTFYKLTTIKGSITIRWCGSSNGYYSEHVSIKRKQVRT